MSNDKRPQNRPATPAEIPSAEIPDLDFFPAPKGWVTITGRKLYRVEECRMAPIQGYPTEILDLDDPENGPYQMVVIVLTRATYALDRARKVSVAREGESIALILHYDLEVLARCARDTEHAWECYLKPGNKIAIKDGKRHMRPWDVCVNPEPIERRLITVSAPLPLPANDNSKQLDAPNF